MTNPRAFAKDVAAQLLCAAGLPWLARRQLRGQLAILTFHGVEAKPLTPPAAHVIDAATLRRQLKFLSRHFTVLPLSEALERLNADTLPDRAAALTFDDGTRNLATQAAPILRELGLPAAVFLATGALGTREALWPDRLWLAFVHTARSAINLTSLGLRTYSLANTAERVATVKAVTTHFKQLPDEDRVQRVEWIIGELGQEVDPTGGPFEMLMWDEARAMTRDARIDLYPHSVTHPILSRCTDQKVDYEIAESCRTLSRETGRPPDIFAYPNGHVGDFDDRTKAALRRNGIRWALSTSSGFATKDSDPLELPRIGIGSDQSDALFQLRVSGALPLRRLKNWQMLTAR